ncbi:MAG: hypothetical protein JXA24_04660 [Proteobacteria bacterium]|nr:hypothetical protein [Pseudomonadota bacterium]
MIQHRFTLTFPCAGPPASPSGIPAQGPIKITANDPFLSGPPGAGQLIADVNPARTHASRFAAQARSMGDGGVVDHERARIGIEASQGIEHARRHLSEGRYEESGKEYAAAAGALEQTDAASGRAFYLEIAQGVNRFRESSIGAALFHLAEAPAAHLKRLAMVRELIKDPAQFSGTDRAKADVVTAFQLMRHAASASSPPLKLLSDAQESLRRALQTIDGSADGEGRDLQFSTRLLNIEIISRLIELAHNRTHQSERDALIEELHNEFKKLKPAHLTDEMKRLAADHLYDSAKLMALHKLWNPALRMARTLAESFRGTPAAHRLAEDRIFEPFVDGDRVLGGEEIKALSRKGRWRKRLQAAIQHSQSEGLKHSALAGAIGMAAGMAGEYLLTGGWTLAGGVAGAGILDTLYRLIRGWNTNEAQAAGGTGTYERGFLDTLRDAARVVTHGAMTMAAWLLPSALLASGAGGATEFYTPFAKAFAKAFSGILDLPDKGAAFFNSLVSGDATARARDAIASTPGVKLALGAAYHLYTKSSLAIFFADFPKKGREWLKTTTLKSVPILKHLPFIRNCRLPFLFLPGAMMLSADISASIVGIDAAPFVDKAWWVAAGLSALGVTESLLMLTNAGATPMAAKQDSGKKRNVLSRFASSTVPALKGLDPRNEDSNWMLPMTASIMIGITAPIGHAIQQMVGERPSTFVRGMIQGSALTFIQLPIALLMSGVAKGKYSIIANVSEAWRERAGRAFPVRAAGSAYALLRSFRAFYTYNRGIRSGTWDLPSAGIRSMLGWNSLAGYGAFIGMNLLTINGATTATWPEPSGTRWDMEQFEARTSKAFAAFQELKAAGKLSRPEMARMFEETKLDQFFRLAGQRMHGLHPFFGHKSLKDRLWQVVSISRAVKPPSFPHIPNEMQYTSIYRLLEEGKVSDEQLSILFEYLKFYAPDVQRYGSLRPLVQTLAFARGSSRSGAAIREFFTERPDIPMALGVDLDLHKSPKAPYGLDRRAYVRERLKEPFKVTEQRMMAHRRAEAGTRHADRLFVGIARPKDSASQPDERGGTTALPAEAEEK